MTQIAAQYRPIDITDRIVRPLPTGARPEQCWLPLTKLLVDGDFQRPLGRGNWNNIQKIADAFDWNHFTPVIVSPIGDGFYSIIDGQHRCHAARLRGVAEVPCLVVQMTVAQQAAAFAAINGQITAITPLNIFRAALVARAPWAIACDQVVSDAGAKLMKSNASTPSKKAGEVYCIMLIRAHVDAGRGAMVTKGLQAIWSAPNKGDIALWSDRFLRPWLRLLQENPRALTRDLGPFLAAHDPLKIDRKIAHLMATDKYRGQSRVAVAGQVWTALLNQWLVETGGQS